MTALEFAIMNKNIEIARLLIYEGGGLTDVLVIIHN